SDNSLAEAFARLERGEEPDEVFADFPHHADELRLALHQLNDVRVATLGSNELTLPAHIATEQGSEYEIVKQVGRGGNGIVFEARQTKPIARTVAVKLCRRLSSAGAQCLVDEATKWAACDHPGIVPFFALESWNDHPMLVMRLIDGGNLTDYMAA